MPDIVMTDALMQKELIKILRATTESQEKLIKTLRAKAELQEELTMTLRATIAHQESRIETHESTIEMHESTIEMQEEFIDALRAHDENLAVSQRLQGDLDIPSPAMERAPVNTPTSSSGVRSKDPLPPPVEKGPVNSQKPWKRQREEVKKVCPKEEDPLRQKPWKRQKAEAKKVCPKEEDPLRMCARTVDSLAADTRWT